jgi:hypothetical protein
MRLSSALDLSGVRWVGVVLVSALLLSCSVSSDLSDVEKSVLVTEADFQDYGVKAGDQPAGKFEKTTDHINRSTELSYATPDGSEGIYVASSVTVEKSAADALSTEWANKAGVLIGLKSAGVEEAPVKFAKPYGARSNLSVLMKDGKPIGNRLNAVVDKRVVMVIFSGIYFDTETDFREFFDAKMQRIAEFQLNKPTG